MHTTKCIILGLAFLLNAGLAHGQVSVNANKLCIHSGGEYYVTGIFYPNPDVGTVRYFPSFTHWASTSMADAGQVYPWKLAGWGWEGMQAYNYGPTWIWETCLQESVDNPYSTSMSFDYPALFCQGVVPHSGFPMPIFGGMVPTVVNDVGGNSISFPNSWGGFDAYLNIFATGAGSWNIPSTQPFYSWQFSYSWDCASAVTVPSNSSVVEYVWMTKGPHSQYCIVDGNNPDCLGGLGNKGRNYSLIMDAGGPGFFWAWVNQCSGGQAEWAQCLFVCDAVTIPVNVPGAPNSANPFAAYGFDVGAATITPYMSSGCVQLGFMTEDYTGLGGCRVVLASFAFWPCLGPYGKYNYRIPHGWDCVTDLFLGMALIFAHTPASPYPACMFGTTCGDHSTFLPFPSHPSALCAEIRFSSYAMNPGQPMSASYMVTYF